MRSIGRREHMLVLKLGIKGELRYLSQSRLISAVHASNAAKELM